MSWNMVPNVVLASLIAEYSYLSLAATNSSLGLYVAYSRRHY